MRRAEFAASCKILDVTHAELLDYQDGQLEFADFSEAAANWSNASAARNTTSSSPSAATAP